jgi:hypothetical protein
MIYGGQQRITAILERSVSPATMPALCQNYVVTTAINAAGDLSVKQLTSLGTYVIKLTNAYVQKFHHTLLITNVSTVL